MEEHECVSIEGEYHDPMEDDNYVLENTFEDDGTNALIHDTFATSVVAADDDVDDGDDDDDEDDIKVFYDIPLLEKATTPLYEGSK